MNTVRYIFGCRPDTSPSKDAAVKTGVAAFGGATIGGGIYASVQWAKSFITAENVTSCIDKGLAATALFNEQLQNWTTTCTETNSSPISDCNMSTMPKRNMTPCQENGPHIANIHDYPTILLGTGAVITGLLMIRSYVNSLDQYKALQPHYIDVLDDNSHLLSNRQEGNQEEI